MVAIQANINSDKERTRGIRGCLSGAVLALLMFAAAGGQAAEPQADYVYRVQRGDTVIGISTRHLADPGKWREVAAYNRLKNPNLVLPADQLRIPLSLARTQPAVMTVAHVEGDVKAAGSAGLPPAVLALGASLSDGAIVHTGKNGYATLRMADGSTVRVQSASQLQVERIRTYPEAGILQSALRLLGGRVESLIQKSRGEGEARHDVRTPMAQMGVRGTAFRMTMDEQARVTRGEVLEGAVDMAAADGAGGRRLTAGFGSVVDAAQKVSEPIALLAAPTTAALPAVQERVVLRFRLDPVAGAKTYRAQLARDLAFDAVLAEVISQSPELRFSDIPDGGYHLRVRAIDANGLEGRDATHAFRLKARPEPPLVTAPASRGKVRASEVEFVWTQSVEAAGYHFQLARDAAFSSVVRDEKAVRATRLGVDKLPLGDYFWRVASVRKDGDRGPFGDVSSFALFAPPAQPEPPSVGGGSMVFRWSGEPGQKFEFQLADNAKFAKSLITRTLDKPEVEVPRPGPGTYYMRFRATDPDGFVGPFSAVQRFSVDPCVTDSSGACLSSSYGIVAPSK